MPETAPLDVSETAVGYELDSITSRNIASVRYVRHHEWLDHVLGNPLSVSNIVPPKLMDHVDTTNMEDRIKQLDAEIAELEQEKEKGWKLHVDERKAEASTQAIRRSRKDFGKTSYDETKESIENLLGVKIEESNVLRKAPITYNRKGVDREQAERAIEKAKEDAEKAAKEKTQPSTEPSSFSGPNPAVPSPNPASTTPAPPMSNPSTSNPTPSHTTPAEDSAPNVNNNPTQPQFSGASYSPVISPGVSTLNNNAGPMGMAPHGSSMHEMPNNPASVPPHPQNAQGLSVDTKPAPDAMDVDIP